MMKTVNVIEYVHGTVQSLHAFPDTIEGNVQAELKFCELAKANGADEGELDRHMEDDSFEDGNGYFLYLVHSS